MSMWTRQETLAAHRTMNGDVPPEAQVVPTAAQVKFANDLAAAAFGIAVVALSIALYVYLSRSQ